MNRYPDNPASAAALDDEALDWFVRRMGGHDDAAEAQLQQWLGASAAHRSAYARWEDEWSALEAVGPAVRRHPAPAPASPRESARRPAQRRWVSALAGCMVLATVILLLTPEAPDYAAHYATQPGELRRVALPDGSTLDLDTDTMADIALFEDRREVVLPEGQAMFEVRSDAARPFDVVAGPVRITVLGTQFAVRYTPGSPGYPGVHVQVESGVVRVAPASVWARLAFWRDSAARRGTELRAGQQLSLDAAGHAGRITQVAASSVAPWRHRQVSFDNITVGQALAEFARYGHPLASTPDAAVAALRITGTFPIDHPDIFYRMLPQVLPVQVRETPAGVVITGAS